MNAVSGSWTLKVSSLDTESLFKATLVILVVAYLVTMVDSMWNCSYTTAGLPSSWRVLRRADVSSGNKAR